MNEETQIPIRVGHRVEDKCRPCRSIRAHTVMVVGGDGQPLRVMCDTCGSQHNYRGARQSEPRPRPKETPAGPSIERTKEISMSTFETPSDLEQVLRQVMRDELGLTPVTIADKWRGGTLVLQPGRAGVQEKTIPLDVFFNKIVMVRNKLRVLEQNINSSELPADVKIKLQGYITGCYGSLTSFNVLFADDDDQFKGAGKAD